MRKKNQKKSYSQITTNPVSLSCSAIGSSSSCPTDVLHTDQSIDVCKGRKKNKQIQEHSLPSKEKKDHLFSSYHSLSDTSVDGTPLRRRSSWNTFSSPLHLHIHCNSVAAASALSTTVTRCLLSCHFEIRSMLCIKNKIKPIDLSVSNSH